MTCIAKAYFRPPAGSAGKLYHSGDFRLITNSRLPRAIGAPARLSIAIALTLGSMATPVWAEPGSPIGPAERIHPTAGEPSAAPAVAVSTAGRRVHVYGAEMLSGGELIGAYEYAPQPQPSPLRLTIAQQDQLGVPAVAMTKYGYFLSAWEQRSPAGVSEGIFARGYSWLGNPLGDAFKVNTSAALGHDAAVVAANGFGTYYLVAWSAREASGPAVRAQLFDSQLIPVGGELRIDHTGTDVGMSIGAGIAPHGAATAYVAWTGYTVDDPTFAGSVYLRSIDPTGAAGAPLLVMPQHRAIGDSVVFFEQPALAVAHDSSIVLAFREQTSANNGYDRSSRLLGRRFGADMQPLGSVFEITPAAAFANAYAQPQVAVDGFGGFTVSWTARSSASGTGGVHARRFDAAGSPLGDAFIVAPSDGDTDHMMSRLAVDADGDTSIAWTAVGPNGVDAMARRYRGSADLDLSVGLVAPPSANPGDPMVNLTVNVSNHAPWPQGSGTGWDPSTEGMNTATGIVVELDLGDRPPPYISTDARWQCAGDVPVRCRYMDLLGPEGVASELNLTISASTQAGPMRMSAKVSGDQHDSLTGNNQVEAIVQVFDLIPDAFAFVAATDVPLGSSQVSAPTSITGIDGDAWAEVTNGEVSVNGGEFRSGWLVLRNGDSVRLRHVASIDYSTATSTTLAINGVSATYTSTTVALDRTPDAFVFVDQSGAATGTLTTSAPVIVSGINVAAPIEIAGGSYSINGAAFTTAAGNVVAGDAVRVQLNSATTASTPISASLKIGGVSDSFTVTTGTQDTSPNPFSFASVSNARRGRVVVSEPIGVSGINVATPISVAGGGASYSKNGGAYTSAAGTVQNGDSVRLRMTASSTAQATVSTTLTIGSERAAWQVTSGNK